MEKRTNNIEPYVVAFGYLLNLFYNARPKRSGYYNPVKIYSKVIPSHNRSLEELFLSCFKWNQAWKRKLDLSQEEVWEIFENIAILLVKFQAIDEIIGQARIARIIIYMQVSTEEIRNKYNEMRKEYEL